MFTLMFELMTFDYNQNTTCVEQQKSLYIRELQHLENFSMDSAMLRARLANPTHNISYA
jgi:hypothetical protein